MVFIVFGLFGFLGKAVKGIGKVVGGAVKVGLGAAKIAGGLGLIPGGGLVGKVAGTLLAAKRPMSSPKMTSVGSLPIPVLRAKTSPMGARPLTVLRSTPRLQQMSPVLPGGAIATRSGPVSVSGIPPMSFGGSASPAKKRKRRKSSRARSSKKRRRGGRRLKFGSPAWRKKYLGKRRKRRRAA